MQSKYKNLEWITITFQIINTECWLKWPAMPNLTHLSISLVNPDDVTNIEKVAECTPNLSIFVIHGNITFKKLQGLIRYWPYLETLSILFNNFAKGSTEDDIPDLIDAFSKYCRNLITFKFQPSPFHILWETSSLCNALEDSVLQFSMKLPKIRYLCFNAMKRIY